MTAAVLTAADEPGQPFLSPDDLSSIQPLWTEAVDRHLMPIVAGVWDDTAGTVHAEMLDATDVDFPFPSVGSQAAEAYLAQARNVYDMVGDDLWAVARSEMLEGFRLGESTDQIADRLRASAGMTAKTAVLVARSTVIEASNAGSIATARASGLEMRKEWIATNDTRTRPTHRRADGQVVDLNAKFTVGGFDADFPADPTLPPQEKFRCRCTTGYVIADAVVKDARRDADTPPLPNTSTTEPAPAPAAAPVEATPAERRAAARARNKAIAEQEPVADFAAELDQIGWARRDLPFDDDTAKILAQRLRFAVDAGVPEADLAAVRAAVGARDMLRVRAEAQRLAQTRGLTAIDAAGDRVPFDEARHKALVDGTDFADGELVDVHRQGHILQLGDDVVPLDKAQVRAIIPEPDANDFDAAPIRPVDGEARLRAGIKSGVKTTDPLAGGDVGQVELVTFNDGTMAVRKIAHKDYVGMSPEDLTDREELAALVGRAIGAPIPGVVRIGAREVLMEYVPETRSGWKALGRTKAQRDANLPGYVDTDDGRLLGLLDQLTHNNDRHHGNWLVRKDGGGIVGIDHGLTWLEGQLRNLQYVPGDIGPFAENYSKRGKWLDNLLSPADVGWLTRQMESLRPQFAARGRVNWLEFTLTRLRQIADHATGTRPMLNTDLAAIRMARLPAQERIAALNDRLSSLRDLLNGGVTEDPDTGEQVEELIAQTQSALAALRGAPKKQTRRKAAGK